MKRFCALLLLFSLKGFSQTVIDCYPLQVCCNKTTTILFPYAIKSVDRGTRDVYVQRVKNVENALEVKAAKPNFNTTSLSVITADGKLYAFQVSYSGEPGQLNISFCKETGTKKTHSKQSLNIFSRGEGMELYLENITISGHILDFDFRLYNHSMICYTPDYIKFFLRDKHKAKRTALQETEIIPLNANMPGAVAGQGRKEFSFSFEQFTIPRHKQLICQVSEQNGGRLLLLRIGHRALLKAQASSH